MLRDLAGCKSNEVEKAKLITILESKAAVVMQGLGQCGVAAVFTNTLEPPEDLRPWVGLFNEGELFTIYSDWRILETKSYILEDEHPGGIHHRHPINKLVAQRP